MQVIVVNTQFHMNTILNVQHIVAIISEDTKTIIQLVGDVQWQVRHTKQEIIQKLQKAGADLPEILEA